MSTRGRTWGVKQCNPLGIWLRVLQSGPCVQGSIRLTAEPRLAATNHVGPGTLGRARSGHYVSDGLAAGVYRVTLVVSGAVKASIMDTQTKADQRTN